MKLWRFNTRSRLTKVDDEIALLRSRTQALESNEKLQLDPDFYIAFEDHFRGPFDIIKERVSTYLNDLNYLANSGKTVVDIGCGRGE